MGPVLAELLPPEAGVAEVFGDSLPGGLFPEEEAIVARASAARRREFGTGRYCAHQALATLGITGTPVLTGTNRQPLWPAGIVGSITHCPGYRAAAVARVRECASIGIDAEPNRPLPARVLDAIALPHEAPRLSVLAAAAPRVCWDRLLFCAKESVFKAWFPVTGQWLGFADADVVIDQAGATFTATLLVPGLPPGDGRPGELTGRFAVSRGLLLTAVTLPPNALPPDAPPPGAATRHTADGAPPLGAQPPADSPSELWFHPGNLDTSEALSVAAGFPITLDDHARQLPIMGGQSVREPVINGHSCTLLVALLTH